MPDVTPPNRWGHDVCHSRLTTSMRGRPVARIRASGKESAGSTTQQKEATMTKIEEAIYHAQREIDALYDRLWRYAGKITAGMEAGDEHQVVWFASRYYDVDQLIDTATAELYALQAEAQQLSLFDGVTS